MSEEVSSDVNVPEKRNLGNPKWKKGVSANPLGRPKGARGEATELVKTLRQIEKRIVDSKSFLCQCQCLTIREHFARRAFKNDKVLVAFMKKIEPDKTEVSGGDGGPIPLLVMDNQPFELPLSVPPRLNLESGGIGR